MLDTITNTPTYFLKRVGAICFCLKCDDSMITITPLRLVTIQRYRQLTKVQ